MDYIPKVSVVIISYNTGQRLLETLESIINQSYENIEIIIADDNSTDNSISIYKKWIEEKKETLKNINIILLDNKVNRGIEKNICNAIQKSSGDFIKVIGDDIMERSYIEKLVYCYEKSKNKKIIWCPDVVAFSDTNEDISATESYIKEYKNFLNLSQEEQKKEIVKLNYLIAPTIDFFPRSLIYELNLFNLGFNYIEDWPCWIVLSQNGYKFSYLNDILLRYRVYGNSISRTNNYRSNYWQTYAKLYFKMRFKLLLKYKYYKTFFKEFLRSTYIVLLKLFK